MRRRSTHGRLCPDGRRSVRRATGRGRRRSSRGRLCADGRECGFRGPGPRHGRRCPAAGGASLGRGRRRRSGRVRSPASRADVRRAARGGCRRPNGPRGCGRSRRRCSGAGARTDRCSPGPSLSVTQDCRNIDGDHRSGPHREDVRRRPTLPRSPPRSTIGAERLSFRVRDGTGRFPFAMVAETLWRCGRTNDRTSGTAQWTRSICGQVLGLLVPVSFTGYPASTSGLSTRWSTGGLTPRRMGDLILKRASRLDAFSGYPCRT